MGQPVTLTEEEQEIFKKLKEVYEGLCRQDSQFDFDTLESLARDLHAKLVSRKVEPRHHSYMIKNRELAPSEKGFYHHLHPVEDLIKFVNDIDANKDPEDQTIGEKFIFEVYTRRWGHNDTYTVKRTKSGWYVEHIGISGDCDKEGSPYLFKNLEQDFVSYPIDLGSFLWSVWERAEQGLSKEEVQELITKIANWVSSCEKTKPEGIEV